MSIRTNSDGGKFYFSISWLKYAPPLEKYETSCLMRIALLQFPFKYFFNTEVIYGHVYFSLVVRLMCFVKYLLDGEWQLVKKTCSPTSLSCYGSLVLALTLATCKPSQGHLFLIHGDYVLNPRWHLTDRYFPCDILRLYLKIQRTMKCIHRSFFLHVSYCSLNGSLPAT